jgi:hypothetical protein
MKKHSRINIYETLAGNMLAYGSEASKISEANERRLLAWKQNL